MRRTTIVPFDATMIPEAAGLLAARHRAHRELLPLLPERFTDEAVARSAVEAAWMAPHASGFAALVDGRLHGYLIGAWRVDDIRGRTAWVSFAGHALAADADAELFRDLYAVLAPSWIGAGCFAHHILIPATDRALLEPWYALGFGQEQAHAIRAITDADTDISAPDSDVTIRCAGTDDLDALLDVADIVGRHQARSPIFAVFPPEMTDVWRESWSEILADETAIVLIAMRGGRVVGFTLCSPAREEATELLIPERCIELRLAAVRAEEQGVGIGRALMARMFTAAHDADFVSCIADWRVPNLKASRFWPRQGFQTAFYRLARRIDERIIWAH